MFGADQVKLCNDVNLFLSDSFSITCNPVRDRDWHGERQLAELGLSRIIVRVRTLTLTFVVSIAARQPLRCAAENLNVLEISFKAIFYSAGPLCIVWNVLMNIMKRNTAQKIGLFFMLHRIQTFHTMRLKNPHVEVWFYPFSTLLDRLCKFEDFSLCFNVIQSFTVSSFATFVEAPQ